MIGTMLILFFQTTTLLIRKLCCMCLKTTKQWSRWFSREEVRQWNMFPLPIELLDWLFDGINVDSKIQIKYTDTKSQLADIPTKGNLTRDDWNHLLCFFLILAISVLQIVVRWCRKERKKIQVKKESQQNRSRWWIQSRDAAEGLLTCLPLLHQKAQGKPDMKVNYLWAHGMSSIKEQGDMLRTLTHQATQSGMLTKSGLVKSGNLMNWWKLEKRDLFMNSHPVCSHSTRTDPLLMTMVDSDTVAESDMSLQSRSFLHRVNDRVRKMLDQSSQDATQFSEKHSVTWWMCMSSTLEASVFMVKNYSDNLHSIKKRRTMSQWNRCSTYLKSW